MSTKKESTAPTFAGAPATMPACSRRLYNIYLKPSLENHDCSQITETGSFQVRAFHKPWIQTLRPGGTTTGTLLPDLWSRLLPRHSFLLLLVTVTKGTAEDKFPVSVHVMRMMMT